MLFRYYNQRIPLSATLFVFTLLLALSVQPSRAQTDTIYSNNQKIICSVKEVAADGVKYTFPGEDVVNTLYKTMVQKIAYASGRTQTFPESASYKTIQSVKDYNKVSITTSDTEVKGLYRFSDVSSKAKGATQFSNQERVKDRGYRKIKIQAAMFGANIILLTNQRTEGNKFNVYFLNSSTAETNLTGIAYSNISIDHQAFKNLLNNRTTFTAVKKFELGSSAADLDEQDISVPFSISKITNEGGIIFIEGTLNGNSGVFQLANINHNSFSIAYKSKGNVYNYVIKVY